MGQNWGISKSLKVTGECSKTPEKAKKQYRNVLAWGLERKTAVPEVVALVVSNEGDITHEMVQASGLVQLGATVLNWPEGYTLLTELLRQASGSYLEFFMDKTEVWLDFEYKYISPGSFVIKQIRELPVAPVTGQLPPVTFSNVDAFEVVQGEFGDMMARHRLKSI